jgi:hypothetical protein
MNLQPLERTAFLVAAVALLTAPALADDTVHSAQAIIDDATQHVSSTAPPGSLDGHHADIRGVVGEIDRADNYFSLIYASDDGYDYKISIVGLARLVKEGQRIRILGVVADEVHNPQASSESLNARVRDEFRNERL